MSRNPDILLKGGRIIDPAQGLDMEQADLLIRDGAIQGIERGITPPEGAEEVDASGLWIVPGLIDMHVHLREPGQEYKETIASGTRAAAAGGFTAVASMPNTTPPNDSADTTRFILERAASEGSCLVYPVAAITKGQEGQSLTEFGDLLDAGAVAFSDDGLPVSDAGMMRLAMEYSLNFDALIISHAEELSLTAQGSMNEGRVSTRLGLRGIPAVAEEIAIFRELKLAELTGARLHIAHVSTKGAVELIRQAKERGIRVTAETAPHYFSLTEEAVEGYNTFAKMNPPLRTEEDRQAMIDALADSTLDAIATDHAPHSVLEKECEFEIAANGIIGLETSLALGLELVRQGRLTPAQLIRLMSTAPAGILGVPGGTLKPGSPAHVTLIDPDSRFEVTRDLFQSKSHNSPFLGRMLKGRAEMTIVGGRIVFRR